MVNELCKVEYLTSHHVPPGFVNSSLTSAEKTREKRSDSFSSVPETFTKTRLFLPTSSPLSSMLSTLILGLVSVAFEVGGVSLEDGVFDEPTSAMTVDVTELVFVADVVP